MSWLEIMGSLLILSRAGRAAAAFRQSKRSDRLLGCPSSIVVSETTQKIDLQLNNPRGVASIPQPDGDSRTQISAGSGCLS